jgi:hypothetical protein
MAMCADDFICQLYYRVGNWRAFIAIQRRKSPGKVN